MVIEGSKLFGKQGIRDELLARLKRSGQCFESISISNHCFIDYYRYLFEYFVYLEYN